MFRKLLLTITLLVLFFALTLIYGWNLLKVNATVERLVIARVQSLVGDEFSVDQLRFGLGSVNLTGVKLALQDTPYRIQIEELKLGYSLHSLLSGVSTLEKVAEEITLNKPVLTVLYNPQKAPRPDLDLSMQISQEAETVYRSIIKDYDFIKKITISEGKLVILDTQTLKEIRLAKQINGWAYTDNRNRAWLRLAGHIFASDDYNMALYGQVNLTRGAVDFINLELNNYRIGSEVPFLIPDYFEVLNGVVNSELTITERLEPTRGFNIEGDVHLENGQLKLKNENLYFADIKIDAAIKDWNLEIKKASQKVNGSPTHLEGRIKNLLAPELDLRLISNELGLETFLEQFAPDKNLPFRGTAQIQLALSDQVTNPRISGKLTSDSLWFRNQKISDVAVDLKFGDRSLSFENISGKLDRAEISGQGSIDFATPEKPIDFQIALTGEFSNNLRDLGLVGANHCVGHSSITIFGPFAHPVSRGEFNLFFTQESFETFALNGSFSFREGQLTLNAASKDNDFNLSLSAENIFKRPRLASVEATSLEHLFVFVDNPVLNFIRRHYSLNLQAAGGRGHLFLLIEGYRRDNYEKLFQVTSDTTASRRRNSLVGEITLFPNSAQPVVGDYEIAFSDHLISLKRFYLGDEIDGKLDFSRENLAPVAGYLTFSGLKLSWLNVLLAEDSSRWEGSLFGKLEIDSAQGQPHYQGNFWLLDGYFKEVGPLKGELSFTASPEEIKVRRLALEKPESTGILANGQYAFATREIDANVAATDIDLHEAIRIATGSDEAVEGRSIVQVSLKGRFPQVPIYGSVKVHHAKILMFEFDEAILDFGSERTPNGSYFSGDGLNIGYAVLNKFGEFTLLGPALLPFTDRLSLGVRMSGSGNLLAMLSDIDPFFEKTYSEGQIELHLTGRYKKPIFQGSKFVFKNGSLRLTKVARTIENLEADLEVVPDDYFLNIRKLQGTLQGQPFAISNTNLLSGLDHGAYEPLRVGGDDLNLGALILETGPAGIPLHIPGLMEGGETGWFNLAGKDSLEHFFVAGPWQRPHLRGEVRVRNANLTFPFANTGEGSPLVQNILNNIDWDLRALTLKDTRYVKEFPTAVYVNMEVDPQNSALEFTGILKDSTFRISGTVESTRGEFEYLDLNFRVEKFGAEFNPNSLYPLLYGKAWTVVRDTANVPNDVYLELYSVDDVTRQEVSRGRWDRVTIKLSSQYPGYEETQKGIMSTLGYSSSNMEEQATRAVGYSTDKFIFRPIMRPIERQLERRLGLDVVRFSYAIARNFLDANIKNEEFGSSWALLRSSRLILGKYLTDDIYVLYTGELKAGVDYQYQNKGVGLQHIVGLEYRLNSRWLLQMEYDYNTLFERHKDDKKIWLRHSFPF